MYARDRIAELADPATERSRHGHAGARPGCIVDVRAVSGVNSAYGGLGGIGTRRGAPAQALRRKRRSRRWPATLQGLNRNNEVQNSELRDIALSAAVSFGDWGTVKLGYSLERQPFQPRYRGSSRHRSRPGGTNRPDPRLERGDTPTSSPATVPRSSSEHVRCRPAARGQTHAGWQRPDGGGVRTSNVPEHPRGRLSAIRSAMPSTRASQRVRHRAGMRISTIRTKGTRRPRRCANRQSAA